VVPRAKGTGAWVLAHTTALYLTDVGKPHEGVLTVRKESVELGIKSFAAIPLTSQGEVVGVLFINSQKALEFTADERRVLELFAGQAAVAIENAHVYEKLRRFSRQAAHQIRNHLIEYDDLEKEIERLTPQVLHVREEIGKINGSLHATTQTLKKLVEDLDFYGEPRKLSKRPVPLNELVLGQLHQRGDIPVVPELKAGLAKVLVDPELITVCLKELLINATKALEQKDAFVSKRLIMVTTAVEDGQGVVRVEDSGPGLPPGLEIFDPGVTTNPAGSGLGLSGVKVHVEAHGGTITAGASSLGGACFEIRLPLLPAGGSAPGAALVR
jgi:signal transduction histidine kinase